MKRRNTPSKSAVLELLSNSGQALSHDMIQANVDSTIDRATIYRVLNQFCADGKVHKIVGDDGRQYFALCTNCGEQKEVHAHNHVHFRCLECGKVECIERELSVPLPKGYVAKVHNLVISGFCDQCS